LPQNARGKLERRNPQREIDRALGCLNVCVQFDPDRLRAR